mgnify:CR=1 FL=1
MSGPRDAGRPDIASRDDISTLVVAFYGRAFEDDLLGPVFVDVAQLDLDAHLLVVTTDFLAGGAVFGPTFGPTPVEVPHEAPIAREVVGDWLRTRGGHLAAAHFTAAHASRWEQPPSVNATCVAP